VNAGSGREGGQDGSRLLENGNPYLEGAMQLDALRTGTQVDPKRVAVVHRAVAEVFLAVDSRTVEDVVLDQARRIVGE
jgi:hypothetical protein